MKKITLLLLLFSFINSLYSQELPVSLRSGDFILERNLNLNFTSDDPYRMLHFEVLPTEDQKLYLNTLGVEFLYYLPKNIFVVALSQEINQNILQEYNVISVNKILADYKIDKKLKGDNFPDWAVKGGLLYIKVLLHKNLLVADKLEEIGLLSESIEDFNETGKFITVAVQFDNLDVISRLSFVSYIEPIDPPALKENNTGRTLHRTNVIDVEYANGRNYNGEGVNVMMHDDGYVEPHIDRKGRVDEQFCSSCSTQSGDDHGDHVSGTIMAAGNLDPKGRGMADGAFLYVLGYSTNNYYQDVPSLYNNYDVVITSASYGNGCNAGYTSLSSDLDAQNDSYSSLIHVFSAGNSGSDDCGYGAGSGWGNVTGGHKQAKNVIAVGNLDYAGSLASSSSRGPADDGRIKPDVCAQGSNVYSTEHNNTYGTKTGTSMACPGISGVLAQLYQAYKEYNSGINPPSALMKCILLNTADDLGNPGPDFKHGWGVVNAYRAVKTIESSNYFNGSITQASSNSHTINIPSSTEQLKLMIYWHDKEGNSSASTALVNDINIQLVGPNGSTYLPYVLNSSANSSALNQNATYGTDNLNNMEQIVVDNPNSGLYTLLVNGSTIPFGPQDYFVSYEFIDDNVELTYPIGGESLVPDEYIAIRWDAIDNGSNFFLEYSTNNGSSWNTISNNISSSSTHYVWQVDNIITEEARFRISRGSSNSESMSEVTIIDVPSNLSVYWPCRDSINVSWSSVSGATAYEVSMLGQKYMDSIFTTSSTNVWIMNPDPTVADGWFSVSSKINNAKGRRAFAVNAQALSSNCSGAVLGCTNPNASNFDPTATTTIAYGGEINNSFGTGSYFYGDQHLNFDSYKECVIKSAIIYSEANNTITFELRNSSGNVLDDTTLNVVYGAQRINLNFDVPIANDLQLGVSQGALQNYGLYRNQSGANYPYDIASAISITSSSATTSSGYYYFYYDIEVETPCLGSGIASWDCDGQGNCYNPGTGNGQYSSLVQCQNNCITASWDCDGQGNCSDPGTGNGQYSSLVQCQNNCITASWDCDGQGNCSDPGTGNGQYSSLVQCQNNCITPSWDCDGQGNCSDPGTGNGQYSSLSQCQNNCITPSWDCDGQGNCNDPGTGNGQYNSLSACETECVNVSINDIGLRNLKVYPNPSASIFNIEFISESNQNLKLRVFNLVGEEIISKYLVQFSGEYATQINLENNSKGIYFLEIQTTRSIIKKKLILQ